jgi:hypothetical protein
MPNSEAKIAGKMEPGLHPTTFTDAQRQAITHTERPLLLPSGGRQSAVLDLELSIRWYTAPSTRWHFREYCIDWLGGLPPLRPLRVKVVPA